MLRGWRNAKVSEAWEGKLREGACGLSSQFQTSYPLLWVKKMLKSKKSNLEFCQEVCIHSIAHLAPLLCARVMPWEPSLLSSRHCG